MSMRSLGGILCVSILLAPAPVAADAMSKAYYMNVSYCAGIAETYSERLSSGSGHGSEASKAGRVSRTLDQRANSFGRKSGFAASEGERAKNQGRNTMAGMLPNGGSWKSGGDIPSEAYRQYKHCETLAEL